MRLPGYCTRCHRTRVVNATSHDLALGFAARRPIQGVCFECEEERLWEPRIRRVESAIRRHGFTVRYVDYCEDSRTPGLLGQIAGVTDRERREVKIGLKATAQPRQRLAVLEHELKHVVDPDWDCGNRDVLGRGGRRCAS